MRLTATHIVVALLAGMLTMAAPESAITLGGVWPGRSEQLALDEPTPPLEPDPTPVVAQAGAVTGTTQVIGMILPRATPPVSMPIFRFYSAKTGTHFYTPSAQERDAVMAKWPDVWQYEGVAYSLNPARNSQPLYRFWNRVNGSHFYTASAAERDVVFAKWMNVFIYEGPTYSVTPRAEAGKQPVWRFYNKKNGSHFYTASASEVEVVKARWSSTYQLEGVAFYLGQ